MAMFRAQTDSPVIIIGAARSGTNMLRDILIQLPGFATWPCDEINYIWRHGNIRESTDELTIAHARPEISRFIRGKFQAISRVNNAKVVVEKTCANTLRVPFVNAIFPNAYFIHIVREGRDVVASAMKRWTSDLDFAYVARKVRYVPISDLPYYGMKYVSNRLHQILSDEGRLARWGPRFNGMHEALSTRALPEVCALQWRACVEKATADLSQLDPQRVIQIRYANFVHAPEEHVAAIIEFLGFDSAGIDIAALADGVSTQSVFNWKKELTPNVIDTIAPIVDPVRIPQGSGNLASLC